MVAAACGAGAPLVYRWPTLEEASTWERPLVAFALGIGILGCGASLLAFIGFARPLPFAILCMTAILGLFALDRPCRPSFPTGWITSALVAAWVLMAMIDLLEALSPQADADTLAYHFALIKEVLAKGRMVFVPRAVDGATPLLIQMTYAVAMSLGGEAAANLWLAVTGWGLPLLTAAVTARRLPFVWAAGLGLLVMTLPVVLYGAGTGQVEVRLALFVTVAVVALGDAGRRLETRPLLVVAVATGLAASAKYTGLVFGAGVGTVVLFQAFRSGRWGAVWLFGIIAALVASPYYLWIWSNTGDPLFPFLYGILPYGPNVPWNTEIGAFMRFKLVQAELAVPKTLTWLLLYPFAATFVDWTAFDSVRAGFGPWPVMIAFPAAAALILNRRDRQARGYALLLLPCLLFYILWFFVGGSQRVRHLLPVVPIALVGMTVLAAGAQPLRRVVGVALAATLLVQVPAQVLVARNHVIRLLRHESREAFLERNVGYGDLLHWVSRNMGNNDRLLHQVRQLNYLLDRPYLFAMSWFEGRVETHPKAVDVGRFWGQARQEGVTHAVISEGPDGLPLPNIDSSLDYHLTALTSLGCARIEVRLRTLGSPYSRAVSTLERASIPLLVFALTPGPGCSLDAP